MPLRSLDTWRTERLVLERLRAADFDDLCRMHRDPVLMASLGGLRDDEVTRRYLAEQLGHWDAHRFGIWMARDHATDRLAGRGGLRLALIEGRAETEVAYALVPEFWGRGLATELARACVRAAFDTLECVDVVAHTAQANVPSQRVLEKNGFAFERTFTHKGGPYRLYRLTAESWRAAGQHAGEHGG
jgi:[ribosomal protein S5]-alanine N-acetyltransferase